ncbi:MAG: hypothetical protein M5U19_16330 [Microthrixaceae bacterium]|nr:hypothetical protein [Microthrixaceae bacterium]
MLGRVPVMARHPSALAVRHLARDLLVCLAVFSLLAASCQGGDGGIDQHTDYEEPPFGAPKTINAVSDATAVAGDDKHTCALIDNGAVRCWLLAGRVDLDELRAPRVEGISRATAISAWERDWCALIDDGTVSCWGQKAATSLDEELSDVMETPKPIEGISGATAIATASDGVCAVVEDGTVRCWGGDYSRSDGPSDRPPVPATIQGISGATTISAAGNRACAVIAEGSVSCWAPIPDEYDDDGHALTPTRPDPLPVDMTEVPGITDAVAISVSGGKWVADFYACALLRDGTVSCWGDDPAKARDPAAHDTTTPLAIPGVRDTSAVAVGTGGLRCSRGRRRVVLAQRPHPKHRTHANLLGDLGAPCCHRGGLRGDGCLDSSEWVVRRHP